MTVTIELKPETEKRLAEKAEEKGLPIETYIEFFIEDKLEESKTEESLENSRRTLSKDERRTEFRKWMNSHKDRVLPHLSDEATRRGNIYEDRF